MTETLIHCPECGATIPISEALQQQIRQELENRLKQEWQSRLRQAVEQAERQARQSLEMQLQLLQEQLEQQRRKTEVAQKLELQLRKEKAELEQKRREFELEIQRRLDDEKSRLEKALREQLSQEQQRKLLEKEKQIEQLRQALADAKQKAELGSQELQGEALEDDVQQGLESRFPHDRIEPVPKGMRGADIVQTVRNDRQQDCGTIVWEIKNTKHWQPAWLDKLKQDQRSLSAPIAVLVSAALPDGINGFGRIDGVWVCGLRHWPALASVLREQLIQVAFARAASEGQNEKMALLYQYLASDEFRQKVETIVEAFEALQSQLQKERRAMEKLWKEREKQLQRVITSTAGMYGDLQGIIGSALQPVAALELESNLLEYREEES